MKYTVSHYHQNPGHNTKETFTNRKDAEAEFHCYTDDQEPTGVSWLESEDGSVSKKRYWNKKRAERY